MNAGDLDTTFGQNGVDHAPQTLAFASPVDIAVQQDDKIVMVATVGGGPQGLIERFNSDGSVDTTFGTNGEILTRFGHQQFTLYAVVAQGNGKILVGGVAEDNGVANQILLARFNSDGSLDSSFGAGGVDVIPFTGNQANSLFLLTQIDGRIVVDITPQSFGPGQIMRLNSDGSVDSSFHVTLQPVAFGNLLEQPDGKLLAYVNPTMSSGEVVRLNSDGSVDSTWSPPTVSSVAVGMALDANQKLLVTPVSIDGEQDSFTVGRFNTDGIPDTSFGVNGTATFTSPSLFLPDFSDQSILIQPDGKIVVAALSDVQGSADIVPFLTRLNADGTPDITFGAKHDGLVVIDAFGGQTAPLAPAAFQSDGKIVIGCLVTNVGLGLARFVTSPPYNINPNASQNQLYVEQLYQDLLDRQADAAGLAGWTSLLDQGTSRTQIVLDIENSTEYQTIEVEGLYTKILGRAADQAGLNGWVSDLAAGGNIHQVEAHFIASPEYLSAHSADPIGAIYQTLLDRPADPSGEAAWKQRVANGLSYYSLAIDFIQSAEYAQDETQGLYLKYLRRSPDPSGLATFISFFEQGVTLESAQAMMLGSNEYFNLV